MKKFYFLFCFLLNSFVLSANSDYFIINPEKREIDSLSKEGLEKLKEMRDAVRERDLKFKELFMEMDSFHHALVTSRIFNGNMFIYGPPGAAKSGVVKWFLDGEKESSFQLQLHQMITEQAFTGIQSFEDAKDGKFNISTEGGMANFETALLDEMEKGNPAALASLLSLLNEREVMVGNHVVKAKLQALYSTSNSNILEFFQYFYETNQAPTASALLNRFQFKVFSYNWPSEAAQQYLDEKRQREEYEKAIYGEASLPGHLLPEVDWEAARVFSHALFRLDSSAMAFYRSFMNSMRTQTYKAVKIAEEETDGNYLSMDAYFPTADYTERSRGQLPSIVKISAFVDFLLSPLADDENLEKFSGYRLDGSSFWRTYLVLTTLTPGYTSLQLTDKNNLVVNFENLMADGTLRDQREEATWKIITSEQKRLNEVYQQNMDKLLKELKIQTRIRDERDNNFSELPFELQLILSK